MILRGISADVDLEADLDRFWALVTAVEDRDFALTVGTWGTHTEDSGVTTDTRRPFRG